MGAERAAESPVRTIIPQQRHQLLQQFMLKQQAQAQARAQQAHAQQAQAQVHAQVQAHAHAQAQVQAQQGCPAAQASLGQQQHQDFSVSPWAAQQQRIIQQEQRSELLRLQGEGARKNSGLSAEVADGMVRGADAWVLSSLNDLEHQAQAKRMKFNHYLGSSVGGVAGLSPGVAMPAGQQHRMYTQLAGHGLVRDRVLSDKPAYQGYVSNEAEPVPKVPGRSSLESSTNSAGSNVRFIPVGSGGQPLLSNSLPNGASQNGTPESNNPVDKNLCSHVGLDVVPENSEYGMEKGLERCCFGSGDGNELDNGSGALDVGASDPYFSSDILGQYEFV
ncbi:unnamed protein product [Ostreobium quekettii]|uniref:Uncharacterized protein n=1 Tax=Ostreobium quekettii TaxID=121088 RepID=A0A8S1J495_9CHLO|nr:unnamed protein product [Ostreobium quekettii]